MRLFHLPQPEPDTAPLPRTLPAFVRYVFRKSPAFMVLFICLDVLHQTRLPTTTFLLSIMISRLSNGGGMRDILWIILCVFLVQLVGECGHVVSGRIRVRFVPQLRASIRADFYSRTLDRSHDFLTRNLSGNLARKATEVGESWIRSWDTFRNQIWLSVLAIGFALILNSTVHPAFGVILGVYIVAYAASALLPRHQIRDLSVKSAEIRSEVSGLVVDSLTNADNVRFFAASLFERAYHWQAAAKEKTATGRVIYKTWALQTLRRLLSVCLITATLALCAFLYTTGKIAVGDITMIMALTLNIGGVAWVLADGLTILNEESGYIQNCLDLLGGKSDGAADRALPPLLCPDGRIEFQNASFQYGSRRVLADFSLTIPAHQKVGLVGASGAGKTTLAKLLLGLYDLQDGALKIDGQTIQDHSRESLRRSIGVIPQDTSLFHRSLLENIRYGRPEATEAEVVEAAKKAHAHDFIKDLPDGYQTLVGERGVRLSGGQRQRIAIARAILKDAPILILDEATSALDSQSEHVIQESLKEAMTGKTVIAIAHRLSTLKSLDRLLVLDQGRIVEDGTHADLLAQGGIYAHLWAMQSGGFVPEEPDDAPDAV
jgi:ATP-binding cassette, subfamily B, bacterial